MDRTEKSLFAENIVDKLLPNLEIRSIILRYLEKLVNTADSINPAFWGITVNNKQIVFTIGQTWFLNITPEYVYFLLEKLYIDINLIPKLLKNTETNEFNQTWQAPALKNCRNIEKLWVAIDYEDIFEIFSQELDLYSAQAALMQKAFDCTLHWKTKRAFSVEFIEYMNKSGYDFPFPSYINTYSE